MRPGAINRAAFLDNRSIQPRDPVRRVGSEIQVQGFDTSYPFHVQASAGPRFRYRLSLNLGRDFAICASNDFRYGGEVRCNLVQLWMVELCGNLLFLNASVGPTEGSWARS